MSEYIDKQMILHNAADNKYEHIDDRYEGEYNFWARLYDYIEAAPAADAIEELSRAQEQWIVQERNVLLKSVPKWIPVTERLPSKNDRYLTVAIEPWFGTTVVDIMRWSGVWMYDGRQTEATVTHWMPLPEPPEEE